MQARYVIVRVLLEAGGGLLELRKTVNREDGKPDVEVVLNRALIPTLGKATIGLFLKKLQTYKSLADLAAGSAMYAGYCEVPPEMAELREIVMARKEPRKLLVQPHMESDGAGGVALRNFEPSPVGMVESFVARFPAQDPELMALYENEKANGM